MGTIDVLVRTILVSSLLHGATTAEWLEGLKTLLEDCPVRSKVDRDVKPSYKFVVELAGCAKQRALNAIDDILEDDVIPIIDGLDLVRMKSDGLRMDNATVTFNIRKLLKRINTKNHTDEKEGEWREKLTSRLLHVLKTHVIKIDVDRLRPVTSDRKARLDGQLEPRGRRRRRRHMQMMPIIMMGVLLMGSVLIPMGFQFLAVLGGKALILAKMALMLSSIQGLKKIATNGVNYGLYHSPVSEPWHERSNGYFEVPYGSVTHHQGMGHFASRSAVQPT